jgi:hypothetical protein
MDRQMTTILRRLSWDLFAFCEHMAASAPLFLCTIGVGAAYGRAPLPTSGDVNVKTNPGTAVFQLGLLQTSYSPVPEVSLLIW